MSFVRFVRQGRLFARLQRKVGGVLVKEAVFIVARVDVWDLNEHGIWFCFLITVELDHRMAK